MDIWNLNGRKWPGLITYQRWTSLESTNKYVSSKEWRETEKPRERWISQNDAETMS